MDVERLVLFDVKYQLRDSTHTDDFEGKDLLQFEEEGFSVGNKVDLNQ